MVRDTLGEQVFSAKPVIQAAFHAARRSGGGEQTGRAGDYVERKEFRTLLVALRQYYELYAMFNRLDTTDDRRIEVSEFAKGVEFIAKWGVKIEPDAVQTEFDSIDVNGGVRPAPTTNADGPHRTPPRPAPSPPPPLCCAMAAAA